MVTYSHRRLSLPFSQEVNDALLNIENSTADRVDEQYIISEEFPFSFLFGKLPKCFKTSIGPNFLMALKVTLKSPYNIFACNWLKYSFWTDWSCHRLSHLLRQWTFSKKGFSLWSDSFLRYSLEERSWKWFFAGNLRFEFSKSSDRMYK